MLRTFPPEGNPTPVPRFPLFPSTLPGSHPCAAHLCAFTFWAFPTSGVSPCLSLCVWRPSSSATFSGFVHTVAGASFLCVAKSWATGWTDHVLFPHASNDGHEGGPRLLAAVNTAALSTPVQMFGDLWSVLCGPPGGVAFLSPVVIPVFTSERLPACRPQWLPHVVFPPAVYEGPHLLPWGAELHMHHARQYRATSSCLNAELISPEDRVFPLFLLTVWSLQPASSSVSWPGSLLGSHSPHAPHASSHLWGPYPCLQGKRRPHQYSLLPLTHLPLPSRGP